MNCPRCHTCLNRATTKYGVLFCCPQCHGRAVGLAVLRRMGSKESVRKLWLRAKDSGAAACAPCPECRRAMVEVALSDRQPALRLDVCIGCEFVWFDPREFEQFPPPEAAKSDDLPEKARELIAMRQVRQVAERAQEGAFDEGGPDDWWQWIPAMLGMPVEEDAPAVTCWPWMTYGLGALLVAVYVLTAGNLEGVVKEFGLVPAQLWRHGGATFVTSFFLHAGILHLLGNVYFLLIFGDNVEDDLGHLGCGVLLVIAAFVGDLWHILGDSRSMIPCIGASGGISGVVTYYALRFPRARLGFLFRYWFYFRWLHIPAYVALVFWFLLQFLYIFEQRLGVGNIAALAHLGGAVVGVGAWLFWRAGTLDEA